MSIRNAAGLDTVPIGAEPPDVEQLGGRLNILDSKNPTKRNRGGRRSRDKGNRAERAIVRLLQGHGFAAERVPLSGSAGGSYLGDLTIPLLGVDRVVEVKVRGTGFSQLYAWLEARDLLVVKADRREPLVILPLRIAIDIATAAERGRSGGASR